MRCNRRHARNAKHVNEPARDESSVSTKEPMMNGPILATKERCDVVVGQFSADLKAHKIDEHWFSELLPGYELDEAGEQIDAALWRMITARFDPTTPYATSDDCLNGAEAQFRAAVRSLDESS